MFHARLGRCLHSQQLSRHLSYSLDGILTLAEGFPLISGLQGRMAWFLHLHLLNLDPGSGLSPYFWFAGAYGLVLHLQLRVKLIKLFCLEKNQCP
jgi:hypothetical protein